MHLTVHTDYALRVLMYVGTHQDRLVNITEISESYDISRNHLVKVVHRLSTGGVLATTRGRSGGIALARPAEEIILGDVVRLTEDSFNIVECMGDGDVQCVINDLCRLKGVLSEALGSFLSVLDKYTLADLVKQPAALKRVLG